MKKGNIQKVTLKEGYQVYTRTVGKGLPILLLHGGPGANHLCFEKFEDYIDLDQFSLIYYDQLGSTFSDKIEDTSLLTLERYVDEVEQVRASLNLDSFILLGHSWGGMLTLEYALKYQSKGHLLGTVISNMAPSIEAALSYVNHLRQGLLTEEECRYMEEKERRNELSDPRYMDLIYTKLYPNFFCRLETYPDFFKAPDVPAKIVYEHFQGNNEFVVTGSMLGWDRKDDLDKIHLPSLVIGGTYDTMNPEDLKAMAKALPKGTFYQCEQGSHFGFLDDSDNYFKGLNGFLSTLNV